MLKLIQFAACDLTLTLTMWSNERIYGRQVGDRLVN